MHIDCGWHIVWFNDTFIFVAPLIYTTFFAMIRQKWFQTVVCNRGIISVLQLSNKLYCQMTSLQLKQYSSLGK